jgi:hypothetical protein
MRTWTIAGAGCVAGIAASLLAQAAVPPDIKILARNYLALSPADQSTYAAGVADGLAMGAFEPLQDSQRLRWCMNGYHPVDLAAIAARHAADLADARSLPYSGAYVIGRAMRIECQLQWPPGQPQWGTK